MISVILYGRNDSHGYNLHKRAAISLNCIAEMLSHPDDEILFVDYNTPDDLPTFIEAIYDTLTPKAKARLRVFRVRPELHARLVKRTHLAALEPHSRNIALRRSNPRNRWILFTNSDMIFLPRGDVRSLSAAVADLPDGQYIVPRFELPEPLWESFPRCDPVAVLRACQDHARKLHLDEVTESYPYMRFDQPGDFQLAPRQALFDVCGFDERMIHGWHADSNMCKRLYLFYGCRTESLAHRLKGYHCDHTRVATLTHRLDIKLENNLHEFVFDLNDAIAHHQAATWGAPGERVEEVDFTNSPTASFASTLERILGAPQESDYHSDSNDTRTYLSYEPRHILPYLAGNLSGHPANTRIAYLGNNPSTLTLLARCVAAMNFRQPLHFGETLLTGPIPDGTEAVPVPSGESGQDGLFETRLLEDYDVLIFDFGVDSSGLNLAQISRVNDWPRDLRYSLGAVARLLRSCAEGSDALPPSQRRLPDFLVINANHYVFDRFVSQYLLATPTPYNTRVRKGRPRLGEDRLYRSATFAQNLDLMRAYFGYDMDDPVAPPIGPGAVIDLTVSARSSAYKDGHWGEIGALGCWTEGPFADIVFSPADSVKTDLLVYIRLAETRFPSGGQRAQLTVLLEGEEVHSYWPAGNAGLSLRVLLPHRLMAEKHSCRLRLQTERSPSSGLTDPSVKVHTGATAWHGLGVKVQNVTFSGIDRLRCPLRQWIDFRTARNGMPYLNESWTEPDNLGTWTLGPKANLLLSVDDQAPDGVIAHFTITDAAVDEQHPRLNVSVAFNDTPVGEWTFGPGRPTEQRQLFISPAVLYARTPLNISFRIDSPRSPDELKWNKGDHRPLGFRLTNFSLQKIDIPTYKIGQVIDFTQGGNGIPLLGSQWSPPDQYGSWTVGKESSLKIRLKEPGDAAPICVVISDCMVSEDVPPLPVRVKANGRVVGEWSLGPDRTPHHRVVELPGEVAQSKDVILNFEIPAPRTPLSMGWSPDPRPLGFRLTRLALGANSIEIPDFAMAAAAATSAAGRFASTLRRYALGFRVAASGGR
jgi:hypothetical protein